MLIFQDKGILFPSGAGPDCLNNIRQEELFEICSASHLPYNAPAPAWNFRMFLYLHKAGTYRKAFSFR